MLSSLHPYRYWEEDGQYFFSTPSGAQYVAYFLELPFARNLYTFNFDKLHLGTHGVVDTYVRDTICTILAYSGLGRITFFQAFGLKVLLGLTVGKVPLENKRKKENGAM